MCRLDHSDVKSTSDPDGDVNELTVLLTFQSRAKLRVVRYAFVKNLAHQVVILCKIILSKNGPVGHSDVLIVVGWGKAAPFVVESKDLPPNCGLTGRSFDSARTKNDAALGSLFGLRSG